MSRLQREIELLREIAGYFDEYYDGVPDSSSTVRAMGKFIEPLNVMIARLISEHLGNSERAERDEALDQIAEAERDVLKAAKEWKLKVAEDALFNPTTEGDELLMAITLLESRLAMLATISLQPVEVAK